MAEGRVQATGFHDWTPVLDSPGTPGNWEDVNDLDEHAAHRLLAHAAALGHQHNGMAEVRPYRWRRGDAEREAEVQERLAAVRARLSGAEPVQTASAHAGIPPGGAGAVSGDRGAVHAPSGAGA